MSRLDADNRLQSFRTHGVIHRIQVTGSRERSFDYYFELFQKTIHLFSPDLEWGGWGDGGDFYVAPPPPTMAEMRHIIQQDSLFWELAPNIRALILQNDKLTAAFHDLLVSGIPIKGSDRPTSYFDGGTLWLGNGILGSTDASNFAIQSFIHELGHFIFGVPLSPTFPNPDDYARARAQAEVNADYFLVTVAKELGISHEFSKMPSEYNDRIGNTGLSASDYQTAAHIQITRSPGLGADNPGDLNRDGVANNWDLYLSHYRGPDGGSYSDWRAKQDAEGGDVPEELPNP
ncbi:MAG: hypothetical protein Q4G62_01390 [Pseudomonadota bacterium]|nr:hypothetical protein [Pseudomonadota bacterium]